jgi:hypothetical protein
MDVHVRLGVTVGLRKRGVDVLTAQEDGRRTLVDSLLLDRAAQLGRVMFSQDADMLAEAARRQREGIAFAGLVYAHQMRATVGDCVRGLEFLDKLRDPSEFANMVQYLPKR